MTKREERPVKNEMPPIKEMPHDGMMKYLIAQGDMSPAAKHYAMGRCHLILSPPFKDMLWHLSVGREDRFPDWREIVQACLSLLPRELTFVAKIPSVAEFYMSETFNIQIHEIVSIQPRPKGEATEAGLVAVPLSAEPQEQTDG